MRTILMNSASVEKSAPAISKVKSIAVAKLQYIAVVVALTGGIIMANAPETDTTQPLIGCGLILVAAAMSFLKGGAQ
ncbi:MAG: hypothetical protein WCJ03_03145 [Bacteroidales bacterium]